MKYDRQLIIQLQPADRTLFKICNDLTRKHAESSTHILYDVTKTEPQVEHKGGQNDLRVDANTRVYFVGHGDLSCMRVAGKFPIEMADIMGPQFKEHGVGKIGIVACYSSAWPSYLLGQPHYSKKIEHNFAQVFHYTLGKTHGVYTETRGTNGSLSRTRPTGSPRYPLSSGLITGTTRTTNSASRPMSQCRNSRPPPGSSTRTGM
jgi:hypothetical protein